MGARLLAAKDGLHTRAAEQAFTGFNAPVILLDDLTGNRESYALAWTQRVSALSTVEHLLAFALRDARAIVLNEDMQLIFVLAGRDLNELQAIFAGVIQQVTHYFHKVVFLT
jgi:inactivated superfamily I helicase